MLMILDGWGTNPNADQSAILQAETPNLDALAADFPITSLTCFGPAVGLPEGIMGNSEVGHLNIGAGRVVYQDLLRIDMAVENGDFFQNPALNDIMAVVEENGTALHLMGLVSEGGVHSQLTHLLALLDMARGRGLKRVFVHAILDGRDTPPDSGTGYLEKVAAHIERHRFGAIATVCGRYYAMDRDQRWERTERAFRLYAHAEGIKARRPVKAVREAYERGETDEFIQPIVVTENSGTPVARIADGDGVVFFNFRADRARQITRAFTDPAFSEFSRNPLPSLAGWVCMTLYDETFELPVAFAPQHLEQILGEVLSRQGMRQLRIAETEKYAHVTYFFNGGEETPFDGEDRCLIPSPRDVPTYDHKPAMSAIQVTDEVLSRIDSGGYDVIVLNFANMDMVGHTGVMDAAIAACQVVDGCVGKIVSAVRNRGGVVLVTADHGNADQMIDELGKPHTAHTLNPVPFILVDDRRKGAVLRSGGALADIAPTMLEILGVEQPGEMTGRSLIDHDGGRL
jgi:2,3-bisphosphoglycerate-independent phosphoglycerate mutase